MTAFACEISPRGVAAKRAAELRALVPVLETDRLTLRAPALDDFPVLLDIDASTAASDISGPRDRERSFSDFAQMTATWLWRGHGWWTVSDAGGAVGFVGIGFEPGDREPELGYLFAPNARGKGYATEAASVARDYAESDLQLSSLVSYISASNTASQNVASKLGAVRDTDAELTWFDETLQVWRHWGEAA